MGPDAGSQKAMSNDSSAGKKQSFLGKIFSRIMRPAPNNEESASSPTDQTPGSGVKPTSDAGPAGSGYAHAEPHAPAADAGTTTSSRSAAPGESSTTAPSRPGAPRADATTEQTASRLADTIRRLETQTREAALGEGLTRTLGERLRAVLEELGAQYSQQRLTKPELIRLCALLKDTNFVRRGGAYWRAHPELPAAAPTLKRLNAALQLADYPVDEPPAYTPPTATVPVADPSPAAPSPANVDPYAYEPVNPDGSMMLPPILDDEWDVCPTATPKRAARPAADPYPTEPRNADGGMLLPLILNDEWEDAPAESVAEPDAADEELLLPPIGDELDAETPTLTPTAQELAPIESAESESQSTENLSLDLPALDLPPFDPATYEDADAESLFIGQTLIRSLDASPVTPSGEEYLPLRSERIMTWLRLWGFVRDYSLGTAPTQSLCVNDGPSDLQTEIADEILTLQARFESGEEPTAKLSNDVAALLSKMTVHGREQAVSEDALLKEALRFAPFLTRALNFEQFFSPLHEIHEARLRQIEDILGPGRLVPTPENPEQTSADDAPIAAPVISEASRAPSDSWSEQVGGWVDDTPWSEDAAEPETPECSEYLKLPVTEKTSGDGNPSEAPDENGKSWHNLLVSRKNDKSCDDDNDAPALAHTSVAESKKKEDDFTRATENAVASVLLPATNVPSLVSKTSEDKKSPQQNQRNTRSIDVLPRSFFYEGSMLALKQNELDVEELISDLSEYYIQENSYDLDDYFNGGCQYLAGEIESQLTYDQLKQIRERFNDLDDEDEYDDDDDDDDDDDWEDDWLEDEDNSDDDWLDDWLEDEDDSDDDWEDDWPEDEDDSDDEYDDEEEEDNFDDVSSVEPEPIPYADEIVSAESMLREAAAYAARLSSGDAADSTATASGARLTREASKALLETARLAALLGAQSFGAERQRLWETGTEAAARLEEYSAEEYSADAKFVSELSKVQELLRRAKPFEGVLLSAESLVSKTTEYGIRLAYEAQTSSEEGAAVRAFRRAARLGYDLARRSCGEERRRLRLEAGAAMRELGLCRNFGAGCKRDTEAGYRLLRRAATYGDAEARRIVLGLALNRGGASREWALRTLKRRASKGLRSAKRLLARWRSVGRGS